jgi:hypothetical protein
MVPYSLLTTLIVIMFLAMFGYVAWIKFHEHLHLHRHEHGPHSSRTDYKHRNHRQEHLPKPRPPR